MKRGTYCGCFERKKPVRERRWVVVQRNRGFTPEGRTALTRRSRVRCLTCLRSWQTTAKYVTALRDASFRDLC
jgi:hypothetical protein